MTIGKHFIFIGTGGRDAESAKTSFQTIRCVMESLRWHNWWQTTSRQTPGESGLCLQWTNPFKDCLMYDKYSLSRLPTTVELLFKRCVIRMAVLSLVYNSSLNSLTFLTHLLYTFKYSPTVSLERFAWLLFYSIRNMNHQVSKCLWVTCSSSSFRYSNQNLKNI